MVCDVGSLTLCHIQQDNRDERECSISTPQYNSKWDPLLLRSRGGPNRRRTQLPPEPADVSTNQSPP